MWHRIFCPRVYFQCRLSYGICTAPVCSYMHQHLCAHLKSQMLATIPLFGHTKILHTLIGMGSAALVMAVPYLGDFPPPSSDNKVLTTTYIKNTAFTLCHPGTDVSCAQPCSRVGLYMFHISLYIVYFTQEVWKREVQEL